MINNEELNNMRSDILECTDLIEVLVEVCALEINPSSLIGPLKILKNSLEEKANFIDDKMKSYNYL